MSGLFRWTMRHGAKIVFVVALLQLVAGFLLPLAVFLSETQHMASDLHYRSEGDWSSLLQISQTLYALTSFAFLLIGSLLIDRADRWLAARERGEAVE